jgi:hypothetical protein
MPTLSTECFSLSSRQTISVNYQMDSVCWKKRRRRNKIYEHVVGWCSKNVYRGKENFFMSDSHSHSLMVDNLTTHGSIFAREKSHITVRIISLLCFFIILVSLYSLDQLTPIVSIWFIFIVFSSLALSILLL